MKVRATQLSDLLVCVHLIDDVEEAAIIGRAECSQKQTDILALLPTEEKLPVDVDFVSQNMSNFQTLSLSFQLLTQKLVSAHNQFDLFLRIHLKTIPLRPCIFRESIASSWQIEVQSEVAVGVGIESSLSERVSLQIAGSDIEHIDELLVQLHPALTHTSKYNPFSMLHPF